MVAIRNCSANHPTQDRSLVTIAHRYGSASRFRTILARIRCFKQGDSLAGLSLAILMGNGMVVGSPNRPHPYGVLLHIR